MTQYYVSTTGNDSNSGSSTQPWKTLLKAGNTAKAGDIITVKPGTYYERLKPINSGTTNNYIKYIAEPGAIIDTRGLIRNLRDASIYLCHLDWVWTEGFTIHPILHERTIWTGYNDMTANETKGSTNIMIKNNHIIGGPLSSQWGHIHIGHYGGGNYPGKNENIIIDGNVLDLQGKSEDYDWMNPEMISLSYTHNCEVKNNIIRGSMGIGICCKGGYSNLKIHHNRIEKSASQAIYLDGYANYGKNVEIYNNYISEVGPWKSREYVVPQPAIILGAEQGAGTQAHIKENVKIYNNIIKNADVGINVGGGQSAHVIATFKNIQIYNNTIVNMTGWGIQVPTWGINAPIISGVIIRNNLMYNCKGGTEDNIYNKVLDTIIENNHYTINIGRSTGTNYTTGDPKFINSANNDFHLQSTSPCINKGTMIGAPTVDYENRTRIGNPDIGAYEYNSSPCQPSQCNFTITQ